MANKISLIIEADDQASSRFKKMVAGLEKGFSDTEKSTKRLERSTSSLGSTLKWAGGILATYFGARALGNIAGGFVRVASSFEKMEVQLDTLTKGKGKETLDELNEWAKKMPVNTEKAVEAFIRMKAMGLEPTIADMTTLVDTTSALGGEGGTLEGISRALGQIQTKGKASAEELMQLAERGIPAYEILQQKLGLTAEQVANIGKEGVAGNVAVKALMEGMAERFGGQSQKMQETWSGMVEAIRSEWVDFNRKVAEAEGFDSMKRALGDFLALIDRLEAEGTLDAWAQAIGGSIATVIDWVTAGTKAMAEMFGTSLHAQLWKTQDRMKEIGEELEQLGKGGVAEAARHMFGMAKSTKELEAELEQLDVRQAQLLDRLLGLDEGTINLTTDQNLFASALSTTSSAMQDNLDKVGPLAEGLAAYKEQIQLLKELGLEGEGEKETWSLLPSTWPPLEDAEEEGDAHLELQRKQYDGMSAQTSAYLTKLVADTEAANAKRLKSDKSYSSTAIAVDKIMAEARIQNITNWAGAALTIMRAFAADSLAIQLVLIGIETAIKYWLAVAHASAGSARALAEHPWPASVAIAAAVFAQGMVAAHGVLIAGAAAAAAAVITSEQHQKGGWIRGGSGTRDDVYLGTTNDQTVHLGMGGEYVVNKRAAREFGPELEAINEGRAARMGSEPIIIHVYNHNVIELEGETLTEFIAEKTYELTKGGRPVVHERGIATS